MSGIIVPVNFSAASTNAAEYALDLANEQGLEVSLLHVILIPPSVAYAPLPDNLVEQMKDDARFNMLALAEKLRTRATSKTTIHTYIELGTIEQQVEQLAKRKNANCVVMGISHESSQKVVYQSNIFTALKSLPVPLAMIPEGAGFKPWKKIAIAYDFSDSVKDLPLNEIKGIPALKGAEVHIVYVKRKNEADPSHAAMQEVRQQLAGFTVRFHLVEADSVEEGFADYVSRHETDLLVLLPKHHSFFEFHKSDSKRILRHLAVPMLSIHA